MSDVKTSATVLVDQCLLHVVNEKYRLHDLVLEYLQMTAKMDEDLARRASPRQARFLSRIETTLRRYSAGDETFSNGGLYSVVPLWDAVTNLDRSLTVGECYRKSLKGVTEIEAWRNAGRLLKLLVRFATPSFTITGRAVGF